MPLLLPADTLRANLLRASDGAKEKASAREEAQAEEEAKEEEDHEACKRDRIQPVVFVFFLFFVFVVVFSLSFSQLTVNGDRSVIVKAHRPLPHTGAPFAINEAHFGEEL